MLTTEQFIQKAKEKGYADDVIQKYLKEKGLTKEEKSDIITNKEVPARLFSPDMEAVRYVAEMEKQIEERVRADYEVRLKEEVQKVKEELKQESKTGIKKVIKRLLLTNEDN